MAFDTRITALKHLGVHRDGGSVSASFVGANEIEYCLFFGIRRPPADAHSVRFEPPVLQWFCPYVYRSPVTGDVSPMWNEDSEPIGWGEALEILNELAPFVADGTSERRWVFEEMLRAARKAASS